MITAEEARSLDPANAREAALELLDGMIRKAAADGKKSLRVPYDLCKSGGGYNIEFKTPGVDAALTDAGFTVNARFEDRQFVDIWIEVSWGSA